MRKLPFKILKRRVGILSSLFSRYIRKSDLFFHLHLLEDNITDEANLLHFRARIVSHIIHDLESL